MPRAGGLGGFELGAGQVGGGGRGGDLEQLLEQLLDLVVDGG